MPNTAQTEAELRCYIEIQDKICFFLTESCKATLAESQNEYKKLEMCLNMIYRVNNVIHTLTSSHAEFPL